MKPDFYHFHRRENRCHSGPFDTKSVAARFLQQTLESPIQNLYFSKLISQSGHRVYMVP